MMASVYGGGLVAFDTASSHFMGSWIPGLLYQRLVTARLNKLSQVILNKELAPQESMVEAFSCGNVERRLMLSCLVPMAASSIVALFSDQSYRRFGGCYSWW